MSDPLSWASMLRVLAGLALVLVVFFLLLRVMKRLQPGVGRSGSGLYVLRSLALSPRERLLLVQVGEQQLLLGAGAQGVRCLHVLPQALDLSPGAASGAPAGPGAAFAERLRGALAARGSDSSSDASGMS